MVIKGKGKERKSIYIAPFCTKVQTKRSGMDHTVLPANNTMPAFLRGVHQMAPPQQLRQQTSNCSSLLIYRPRKDERLSWPSWLTYSRWLTHISDHPSATSRAQDSESTSAKDRCSTAGSCHQLQYSIAVINCLLASHIINRQVVKIISQKGRISAAHGRFNRIHQVTPMCIPI